MALIIGGGISIGGQITISPNGSTPLNSGMLFEYNAGNSMSYSGSGSDFGSFNNGPRNYNVNYLFDLNSDITTATLGNYGLFNTSGTDASAYWVSQGNQSYFKFNIADGTYIDTTGLNGALLSAGSSYTYFAMVNVNDFGTPTDPGTWTGGIAGGDQTVFGFIPQGSGPSNYPILMAGNTFNPDVADIDTQFQPNTWYAVAVTYNADSQVMKLYVDGVNTATASVAPFSNPEPLYWGTWEGANWMNGKMGVMTAWNRALSSSEITTYTNNVSSPYQSTPLQTYSQLFTTTGQFTFTVPAGVTSISTVAVGAGAGGTQDGYSPPGQLSGLFDPATTFNASTTLTSQTQIQVDGATYPGILDVTTDYMVAGNLINSYYPNLVPAALLVVSSIDKTDVGNVLITTNKPFTNSTPGDEFTFTKALVAADGGYENFDSTYQNLNGGGPGPRALPLVYNGGGGRGGVVDYIESWGLGGGGAGGYGIHAPFFCFDPNQTRINDGDGNVATGVANVVNELSNYNLTVASTVQNLNGNLGIATGTYEIESGEKVMFSLTVDLYTDNNNMGIGFGNYDANIGGSLGGDVNSAGFYNGGAFAFNGGVPFSGYPSFYQGDVVDIAVADTGFGTSQLLWIRVNGGDWNGDPTASPTDNTNGVPVTLYNPIYLMTTQGDAIGGLGQWSINTSNAYSIPSGYTFIAGDAAGGSTGGDGSMDNKFTAKPGQMADGAGSGAGGSGRYNDSGTGGGGVGLYGAGNPGTVGTWASSDDLDANYTGSVALGGRAGSRRGNSGTQGGQATAWNGGYGGWPGAGGGSATGFYDSGQGGALAFSNNISVTTGQQLSVFVGKGGVGVDNGGSGANGAVRIIWPGDTRQFPASNVGADPTGPSSITIGTTDFTNGGGGSVMDVTTSGGYVTGLTGTGGGNIIDNYAYLNDLTNASLAQDLTAFFRQAGMTTVNSLNFNGANNPNQFNTYIFNVTWADSSTGKVRMSWNIYGQLNITVIDTAYTDWETSNPANSSNSNPVKAGTFNFPATFTPVTPLIESNGNAWC